MAADLNAEYNNILNNGTAVAFPATAAVSMGGFALNFDAASTMSLVSSTKGLNLSATTAINDVFTTVASATTPDIWTAIGGVVNYTGVATATGFAAAPQAGARRVLVCAGAAIFTAGANMLIQGVTSGNNYTAAAGDVVNVFAITTTQFRLIVEPASGLPNLNTQTANTVYAGPASGAAAIPTFRALGSADLNTTWAVAGGTADAITAVYSPVSGTLFDGQLLGFRATAANATTTPTFAPDGGTARTITKVGGKALIAGDISAALAEYIVRYNLANTRWELLNPAFGSGQQGSFIATITGMTATVTGTAFYSITNNVVALYFPALNGTSNTTACTITGLTAAITPTTIHQGLPVVVEDNGVNIIGRADVGSNSIITLFYGAASSVFTNSGPKGLPAGAVITYNLN